MGPDVVPPVLPVPVLPVPVAVPAAAVVVDVAVEKKIADLQRKHHL